MDIECALLTLDGAMSKSFAGKGARSDTEYHQHFISIYWGFVASDKANFLGDSLNMFMEVL